MRSELQKEIDEWLGNDETVAVSMKPLPESSSFFDMVDEMVRINKRRRSVLPKHVPQSISPVQFAVEFCTIKCDVGRRTGKTEYVKQRADQYSLVIVHNKQLTKGYPANIIVKSIGELTGQNSVRFGRIKPRTIYIEEPEMVFRTMPQHELYYRIMDGNYDQTFVLLGA